MCKDSIYGSDDIDISANAGDEPNIFRVIYFVNINLKEHGNVLELYPKLSCFSCAA